VHFWRLALLACVCVVVLVTPTQAGMLSTADLDIGLTFSPREATYRDLSWQPAFDAALDVSPALVRLGAYWHEIEPTPGVYDFSTIDWLLDRATARQQRVLFTVGMKAPRWPEYYLPWWLANRLHLPDGIRVSDEPTVRAATLAFVRRTVEHVRERQTIAAWQVENEPLDPSGPHAWHIGADFLAEEIAIVRELDDQQRPVVVTAFVETHPFAATPRGRDELVVRAREVLAKADVLGLDVYPTRTTHVFGTELTITWPAWIWSGALGELRSLATDAGKDAWIVEAQAEPWVIGGEAPPPAWPGAEMAPARTASVLGEFQAAGYRTVLLWGVEHWEARRTQHEDVSWWGTLTTLFAESSSRRAAELA
jgi:hypothetical protein